MGPANDIHNHNDDDDDHLLHSIYTTSCCSTYLSRYAHDWYIRKKRLILSYRDSSTIDQALEVICTHPVRLRHIFTTSSVDNHLFHHNNSFVCPIPRERPSGDTAGFPTRQDPFKVFPSHGRVKYTQNVVSESRQGGEAGVQAQERPA